MTERIASEREINGPYTSLADFIARVSAGIEQLVILIRLNAFRFTGRTKKQLLWEAHMLIGKYDKQPETKPLFAEKIHEFVLPELRQPVLRMLMTRSNCLVSR